jgi:hypothetical protein
MGFRRLTHAAETQIWSKAKISSIKAADTTLVKSRG